MSITVMVRRVAQPGAEEALLQAMVQAFETRHGYRRSSICVFQSEDDRAVGMYVAEWESRDAYLARDSTHSAHIDELCRSVERHYYERLHLFERMLESGPFVMCTKLQVPPAVHDEALDYLLHQSRPAIWALPGCVYSALHRDLDIPGSLFAMHRWRTAADVERYDAVRQDLGRPLIERGVRIERFRARCRGETALAGAPAARSA